MTITEDKRQAFYQKIIEYIFGIETEMEDHC